MIETQRLISQASSDRTSLCSVTAERVLLHAAADAAFVVIRVGDRLVIEGTAGKTSLSLGYSVPVAHSLNGVCIRENRTIVDRDISRNPSTHRDTLTRSRLRAYAAAPLRGRHEILGTLCVARFEPGFFSEEILGILQMGANRLAAALDEFEAVSARDTAIASLQASEKRLIAAKLDAERAVRAKAEFLAHMSHEIRTPLNGLIGVVDLLAETQLSDRQQEYLQVMRSSGQGLLAVVNDILDLSKIEAGKLQTENVAFDLEHVIKTQIALSDSSAQAKGIAVSYNMAPALQKSAWGDPVRIGQILLNLLSNAIKFTPKGEVSVSVTSEGSEASPWMKITVIDSGIGLTQEAQNKLFQPFSQADISTARNFGGTGLGLAIVRRLVLLMSGEFGVQSTPSVGSRFWVRLPQPLCAAGSELRAEKVCDEGGEKTDSQAAAATSAVARAARKPAGRVLVCDDNKVNQWLMAGLLTHLGFAFEIVENGPEAVQAARCSTYSIILMDCIMPGMDGYEATRHIRRAERGGRRTPIVAVTARALEEDQARCEEAGMDGYLVKPLSKATLKAALDRWLAPPTK